MNSAKTARGTEVHLSFIPDCEDNEGGWFVEIYLDEYGDYYDYFCVHPEDCDCRDEREVLKWARDYVSTITEY